jgi:hypothetical protein
MLLPAVAGSDSGGYPTKSLKLKKIFKNSLFTIQ